MLPVLILNDKHGCSVSTGCRLQVAAEERQVSVFDRSRLEPYHLVMVQSYQCSRPITKEMNLGRKPHHPGYRQGP